MMENIRRKIVEFQAAVALVYPLNDSISDSIETIEATMRSGEKMMFELDDQLIYLNFDEMVAFTDALLFEAESYPLYEHEVVFEWQKSFEAYLDKLTRIELVGEYGILSAGDNHRGSFTERGYWRMGRARRKLERMLYQADETTP